MLFFILSSAALLHPLKEKLTSQFHIPESDMVSADAFSVIHTYIYSESLCLTQENLLSVLTTAHYLQLQQVIKLALVFLKAECCHLQPTVAVAITEKLTDIKELQSFRKITLQHITSNAEMYCLKNKSDGGLFLNFSSTLMVDLLEQGSLNMCERDVFKMLMSWLAQSSRRLKYADNLLFLVRLGLVPGTLLLQALKPRIVPYIQGSHSIILEILESRLDRSRKEVIKKRLPSLFILRKGEHATRTLCFGGTNRKKGFCTIL